MKNYREIAESVLERRDKYLEMQKHKKSVFIKTMSSVFGIALAGFLSVAVYNNSIIQEIIPEQNNSSYNVNSYTKPTSEISVTTETYTTNAVYTTVSSKNKPVQTTLTTVCTNISTETTANSVIPTITSVHTAETTVYDVPKDTEAVQQTTVFFVTAVSQTYITSVTENYEVNTTVNASMNTEVFCTATNTVPDETAVFSEGTMFIETSLTYSSHTEENMQTETSTTTDIQTCETSHTDTTATTQTETFVLTEISVYEKFTDTETYTTTAE